MFEAFARPPVRLRTTAEVLPREVEVMRRRARRWQKMLGRTGTRLSASLNRRRGWPHWPAYTGWHTQQLTKLAVAAEAASEHIVAIDSDVVVTPHASIADFVDAERVVCFSRVGALPASSRRKVFNWNVEAHRLFGETLPEQEPFELYFDTPFVFHAQSVQRMLSWLEAEYTCPWWRALLRQPAGRWSEFGSYRVFLRRHPPACGIDWRDDRCMRFLTDAEDPEMLSDRVAQLLADPSSHYITIHSRSSRPRESGAGQYTNRILNLLPPPRTSTTKST